MAQVTNDWWELVGRFLTLRDPFVRAAVLGAVLLGINGGMLGTFLVVRRMALVGDTLAHAVLPGVVGGYLWNLSKDPAAMLVGAVIAGVLGTALMNAVTATTKLKADAAQGLVLTGFFAVGVCLIALLPPGNKGGVDKFLFGQLAAVSAQDLGFMVKSTVSTLIFTCLAYRGLLVLSFDPVFGRLCGLPIRWLHYGLMLLMTLGIVVAMESVGVVLVSALLVIPASAASLLSHRLHYLLPLAALFGVLAALAGTFFSFVGDGLPAGPMVVLCAASIFVLASLFGPRDGVVSKWLRLRRWRQREAQENDLKAIYRSLEACGKNVGDQFSPGGSTKIKVFRINSLRKLLQMNLLTAEGAASYRLTPEGQRQAKRVVRNHRLWELYLATRASFATDHVHDDAERMEHWLTDEEAQRLALQLGNPTTDPHGRRIP